MHILFTWNFIIWGDVIENLALVLGGGGAKGAYEIGVIKALHQYNLYNNITAFSGTSIGAINMVLIQKVNISEAINIWLNKAANIFISNSINVYEVINMLRSIKLNIPLKKTYLYERDKLINLFDELEVDNIDFSNKIMYAACVDVTEIPKELRSLKSAIGIYEKKPVGQVVYLPLNYKSKEVVYKTLLASSSLPLIYEPIEINQRYYVDGGLIDNLPIKPLYDYGYKDIIVVSCDMNVKANKLKALYPNSNLHFIKPSYDLGNLINGTLNFNRNKISQSINLGYRDGINFIKKLNL